MGGDRFRRRRLKERVCEQSRLNGVVGRLLDMENWRSGLLLTGAVRRRIRYFHG